MYVGATTSSSTQYTQQDTQLPEELRKELGKDDFLKLLLTELTNQDPMSPMKNNDFIAQMAQFSSLEQMTNVSTQLERLAQLQLQAGMMNQATSLIGRTVSIAQEEGDPIVGEVTKVKIVDGIPQIEVNGETYPMDLVTEVS